MKPPRPSTLRRTWTSAVAQLVAIVVGLGVLAVGFTWYQREAFDDTTSHVEREMGASTALIESLKSVLGAAAPVMYGVGGEPSEAGNMAVYDAARGEMYVTLDAAAAAFREPSDAAYLDEFRTAWQEADAAILAAPDLVASGALTEALAEGTDPYAGSVWEALERMDDAVDALNADTVAELGVRVDEVDRIERVIAPAVLGAFLLALALSWSAVRRVSRRVLVPLATLRRAALDMRESTVAEPVVLVGAASELEELAATLNETSATLRASHDVLRDRAESDPLTGLPNRRAFTQLLQATLSGPDAASVAVLFIDLDDFKNVNDSLGHAAGDELLRVVARRLRTASRTGETVARLGGDEFAIVVVADTGPAAAIAVAERTLSGLSERLVIDGTTVDVTCSIGVAMAPPDADEGAADELVRNADFAMYMAKSQGKHRFELFAPTMHAELRSRAELQHELGHAARLDQLVLAYQPVVDLASRDLLGFEALVRWQHPTRGLLQPDEFVSLAEDTGDIVGIGDWVLEGACRALSGHHLQWQPGQRALWVSINVSPIQIAQPDFVGKVKAALGRHGVPAGTLMIEVTEGVAVTNTEAASGALRELRRAGVRVALDDFGTGFSSLRTLHELPIDVIKIDRLFVATEGAESASMLDTIVTLGHRLGLSIIAEGIETADELARLTRYGIAGQGNLFARPLSPADAVEFRRAHAASSDDVMSAAAGD